MTKIEREIQNGDGIGYNQMPPKDIFAYNELRSCFDLSVLYSKDILDIQPEFQRNEVWELTTQTRFIDSLLKEMPIPSMCFSYDKEKNEMRVIDGLQRLSSIIKFLDLKKEWRLSKLKDIDPRISGKTNIEIEKESKVIFDNIRNLSLPVTFLRVDHNKPEHDEYLFEIFHRLNTYGKKLNDQEIRNCIFSGPFNSLLKELNKDQNWRKTLNFSKDTRFLKVELILRFFAFFDNSNKYDGILTKFLNDYMSKHRRDGDSENDKRKKLFQETVSIIIKLISGKNTGSRRLSNAFVDSLLFGVGKNLSHLRNLKPDVINDYYKKLNADKDFREENLLEGTMKKDKVSKRLKKAQLIFSGK